MELVYADQEEFHLKIKKGDVGRFVILFLSDRTGNTRSGPARWAA